MGAGRAPRLRFFRGTMSQQIWVEERAVTQSKWRENGMHEIAPDLAFVRLGIANVVFVGVRGAGDRGWVLVDAGVPMTSGFIETAAAQRFGEMARPAAILLTHGHFDHVGALEHLAKTWECPVVAHPLEAPYLTGVAAYPPADASVGGGLMALVSHLYPRSPVNVAANLQLLENLDEVPFLSDLGQWRALHTPGHSAGHVSFWRESDRTLIVGDAFITTAQESAYAALSQAPELHGPPMYFTTDWENARNSVQILADLEPELVVTGHGPAMFGSQMREALHELARDFENVAVPQNGKYVENPARAQDGSAYDLT